MAEEKELTGWERSRAAQKGYGNFYAGLAIATAIVAGIWIGSRVFNDSTAFGMNLWTEALGMLVTVGLFGLISKYLADERYKQQLVDEAGSNSNEIARHAVYVLYRRQWRKGEKSVLRGADLHYAQLQNADFSSADISKANFERANLRSTNFALTVGLNTKFFQAKLQKAVMRYANLESANFCAARMAKANLEQANLRNASFDYADLSWANLREAKLQGARFKGTDLYGTDFGGANLEGAVFETEKFDEHTILPDNSHWFPQVDMSRFTEP